MKMFDQAFLNSKRWFKGKNRPIQKIQIKDSFVLESNTLFLLSVLFEDGNEDLYAIFENDKNVGTCLAELFNFKGSTRTILGRFGQLQVTRNQEFSTENLKDLIRLEGEQSNSSFLNKKYFFKLFRRLLNGIHPENEVLLTLQKNGFSASAQYFASLSYLEGNSIYVLGILSSVIEQASSAWDYFQGNFSTTLAAELGKVTADMHKALKTLSGNILKESEVPFFKLEKLLKANLEIPSADLLLQKLPALQELHTNYQKEISNFPCQRVHGDYHLGQILYDSKKFWVVDFEGEPSRSLSYRRSLQSIGVDLAGMLRSFRYASAVFLTDTSKAENAFLESYAKCAKCEISELQKECRRFYLAKAIYEACYELEFRPTWFSVPAKALLVEF